MIDASQSDANVGDTSLDITIARGDEFLTVKSAVAYTITFPSSAVTLELTAGESFGCNVAGMIGQTITLDAATGNLGKVNVFIEKQCGTAGV